MEVSLRTQQMLKQFIEEDRVQKQAIMNEINRVRNIAYNNNQIGRESLRREWKGLRKFNSCGQLHLSGFEDYPPHLERPWAQVDRPDPCVPLLPANREICSVDGYYSIVMAEADTEEEEPPARDPPSWSPGHPRCRTPESARNSSGDTHSFPAHLSPYEGRLPRHRHRT